jgi:hypothetical protein
MSFMLSVFYAECHSQVLYAKCSYAECRYAECRYAECRNAECSYAECHYAECRSARSIVTRGESCPCPALAGEADVGGGIVGG